MPSELAIQIAQQATALPYAERQALLNLLSQSLQHEQSSRPAASGLGSAERQQAQVARLSWLKVHRDKYAGQYVAFADAELVAHDEHIQTVRETCRAQGVTDPVIVFLFALDTHPFGGW